MISDKELVYAKSLERFCDDPMPGYFELINKTWITFQEFGLNFTRYPPDYYFPLEIINAIKVSDIFTVVLISVFFTILRITLTKNLFTPVANWFCVRPEDMTKFNESFWKTTIYGSFWSYSRYIIISSGKYTIFDYPLRVWKNLTFTNDILKTEVPEDIYWLYVFQLGFYLYSIYAIVKFDAWRSDSNMLVAHHILTIFLLGFSFIMRYHMVGALVLYLHDVADVVLEFTKMNVYLKSRKNCNTTFNRHVSNFGYVCFVFVWFLFRLHWYPLKVLHMTNWGVYITQIGKEPKMYVVFNSMLMMLLILNMYWFFIILKLGYKLVAGQLTEIEDVREIDQMTSLSSKSDSVQTNGLQNGGCCNTYQKRKSE